MDKKILVIPSWYPNNKNDLVGSFYKEQAQLLNKNGFDLKILLGIEHKLSLTKYILNIFKSTVALSTSFLKQDPEAFSFDIYYYKKWSEKKKLQHIKKQYKKAFDLLSEQWKPELIHAQCTANAGIYASYLSKTSDIPFVIIEHQIFLLNVYPKTIQKEMIQAIENATKIGAVSYHQKRCILMHNINCNPVITWNLMDETKFDIIPKTSNSKFTILTITYPHFIKDSETFFKSIQAFKNSSKIDFEVIVIGNDSFKDITKANSLTFESQAKAFDVFDKCTFYPHLNREEIKKKLQECNVFVSTSIAETYGVAPREAMLCGKPVISTKSGGIEDSLNSTTGVSVQLKDYKAIANHLNEISSNELSFSPENIRNFIIEQAGQKAFIKIMSGFYNL
ncbi:glycosyltransferase [Psychroserpens sp.]|uniref:glycosyltransferase n=1 Tax=Psychroserpens sp. TaxID=2020870 RepID=UPI002B269BB0|nr:glycosyltransferase [Psychroserpens sp.]